MSVYFFFIFAVWFRLAVRTNLQNGSDLIKSRIHAMREHLETVEDEVDFAADILWLQNMYSQERVSKCIAEFKEINTVLKDCTERLQQATKDIKMFHDQFTA